MLSLLMSLIFLTSVMPHTELDFCRWETQRYSPCYCDINELDCNDHTLELNPQDNSVLLKCNNKFLRFIGLQPDDNIQKFELYNCPLPDTIKKLTDIVGIMSVKHLQIHLPNGNINKLDLEGTYYVTRLDLNNNGIISLPSDLFKGVGKINLTHQIRNFDIFSDPKLEELDLGENKLTRIDPGVFKNLLRLRKLNLRGNNFITFDGSVISDIPNLEELDLSLNQIETVGQSNLIKLKVVRLSRCKITALMENTFSRSSRITDLHLDSNFLTSLPETIFSDLIDLKYLDLSQNAIKSLPETLFLSQYNLKTLKLYQNQIAEIPELLFLRQVNLEFLDLSSNKLEHIDNSRNFILNNLKVLNISNNQLTTLNPRDIGFRAIEGAVLAFCDKLEEVQLANNSLTSMFYGWWLWFEHLHTLNLSYNSIEHIQISRAVLGFSRDVMIDVSNNNISGVILPSKWTGLVKHIKPSIIKLENNPFKCDCHLQPFVEFLQNVPLSDQHKESKVNIGHLYASISPQNLTCNELSGNGLEMKELYSVNQSLLTCELRSGNYKRESIGFMYVCPVDCTCHYRTVDRLILFNCENQGLWNIPTSLPLVNNSESGVPNAIRSELNLSRNKLKSVTLPKGNGYENLTVLDLSHNDITEFIISGVSTSMKVLDLSFNKLSTLSSETVKKLRDSELTSLALHNNPWKCDCITKPLIQFIKDRHSKLINLENVTCSSGKSMLEVNENELCFEIEFWLLLVTCVILASFFVLAILCYLYPTHVKVLFYSSPYTRWLVFHQENDDTKEYDAFISYANEDEDFVINELLPLLEGGEMMFKLCIHYRDWIPGDTIQDQIIRSITSSRRTIIVLSPSYLNSQWGLAEFQAAHAEFMNGNTKVIVIVYQDVSSHRKIDVELRAYLRMNTYLVWGTKWFRRQLLYALPHPSKCSDAGDVDLRHCQDENVNFDNEL